MRAFLAGVCFLLASIDTGNSLECVECHSYEHMDCTGELVTCSDASTACQTYISYLKYEGKEPNHHIFKRCSEKAQENYIYKEEGDSFYYQLEVKACKENGCNREPLQFPLKNSTLNGVTCPTCYVEHTLSCEPNGETVQCTGDLTKCIYVAGTSRISDAPAFDVAYHSCTNIKNVLQFPNFPGELLTNVQTLQLTDGV